MTKINFLRALVTLLLVVAFHSSAIAAGFDCAKASTSREKLICSDPELSDLDGQLDQAYKEHRALLSPQGAELLQKSELSWLRFITIVCSADLPVEPVGRSPKECLQQSYKDRLKQISEVGQKIGPFIFNHIDMFAAKSVSKQASNISRLNGERPGFYTARVSYPQIDNMDTPMAEFWNEQEVKKFPDDQDCDHYITYNINYVNTRLISTTWFNSTYCHDMAHPLGSGRVENLVLDRQLRQLDWSDLFGDNKWITKFKNFVREALQEQGWKPPDGGNDIDMLVIATDPDRWEFGSAGIEILFNPYDGGCYACNPQQPVIISWDKLRPLLAPNSIVP